jgi:hypothetical protein
MLALLFGSLALNFVTFTNTLKLFQDGEATADQFNAVAADFRKSASQNATFFVYTGMPTSGIQPFIPLNIVRHPRDYRPCLYILLYVRVVIYVRGEFEAYPGTLPSVDTQARC